MVLIQKLSVEVLTEDRRAEFLFNVDQQSGEISEAKKRFISLRDRLLKNEVNDFGFDYRAIVSHLQNVEVKLRAMIKELEELEIEMECANGVECGTDGTIFEPPFNHHPITTTVVTTPRALFPYRGPKNVCKKFLWPAILDCTHRPLNGPAICQFPSKERICKPNMSTWGLYRVAFSDFREPPV
eukprot:sb/3471453/